MVHWSDGTCHSSNQQRQWKMGHARIFQYWTSSLNHQSWSLLLVSDEQVLVPFRFHCHWYLVLSTPLVCLFGSWMAWPCLLSFTPLLQTNQIVVLFLVGLKNWILATKAIYLKVASRVLFPVTWRSRCLQPTSALNCRATHLAQLTCNVPVPLTTLPCSISATNILEWNIFHKVIRDCSNVFIHNKNSSCNPLATVQRCVTFQSLCHSL